MLDLRCGFGAFDRWAVEQGAARVIGIDLSEKMLSRARQSTTSDAIDYRRGDLAALDISERDFDLIYSSLAFHYIEDFHGLCTAMRPKLVDRGRLVASIEHPIFSAPGDDGWHSSRDGLAIWPLNHYSSEGSRTRHWFADGVIKHHRRVDTYVNALIDNGFALVRLVEWAPDAAQVAEHPEWAREVERPMFLILAAEAV